MGWDPTSAAWGVPDFGSKKGAPLYLGAPLLGSAASKVLFWEGVSKGPPPLAISAQLHLIQGDLRVVFYLTLSLGLHFFYLTLSLPLLAFRTGGGKNLREKGKSWEITWAPFRSGWNLGEDTQKNKQKTIFCGTGVHRKLPWWLGQDSPARRSPLGPRTDRGAACPNPVTRHNASVRFQSGHVLLCR